MTDDLKDAMHVIDLGRVMNGDLYHGEDSGVLCAVCGCSRHSQSIRSRRLTRWIGRRQGNDEEYLSLYQTVPVPLP